MGKRIFSLFDGNALAHRAYHALPPLSVSKTGETINAVYGFASMLLKAIGELKPDYWAVAFDSKAPTFREAIFKEYKAQRPPLPEDLAHQLDRIRELVQAFNIPIFQLDAYEADDIIGTLSLRAGREGILTIAVTGDADIMQLVSPQVRVLYPKPGRSFSDTILYDEVAVEEKFGVPPQNIPDYKALVGDPSDNIPGVPGIGPKTAVRLIRNFGSLEGIYDKLDEVTPPRLRQTLEEYQEQAFQSKQLAIIDTNAPLNIDFESCKVSRYDQDKVPNLFKELEFYSLLPKLPTIKENQDPTNLLQGEYHIISSAAELSALKEKLISAHSFALLSEISGPPIDGNLQSLAFSSRPGEAYYIPLEEKGAVGISDLVNKLGPVLGNPMKAKVAHDAKPMLVGMGEGGIKLDGINFDTVIAAYLLGKTILQLGALAWDYLAITLPEIEQDTKRSSSKPPSLSSRVDSLCARIDVTGRLATKLKGELEKENLFSLFADVEMPLVSLLAKMERNGVLLDTSVLERLSHKVASELQEICQQVYSYVGHSFNINSPQQLSRVLFEELRLPPPPKKHGSYSTEAAVLEELRGLHPVVELVLDYRQLAKLKSTYIDNLPTLINPRTGRLHTTFHQTRTATGRLSSSDPNLQNIPVRSELGQSIRRAFVAPQGMVLMAADYSQIDLRVLAHLSQDKDLLDIFRADGDIHSATAARLFDIPPDKVTPEMRRLAKTVNFGIIYGMSGYGLEQATDLSREESERFIDAYFEKHPGVKNYLEKTKEQARQRGYVESILGRRRYLPEINASNRVVREAAERMAINMPVQGTSADIIKVAMVKLDRELVQRNIKSRPLLQVHDELIFEVPDEEANTMRELVRNIMETAVTLSVPLKVDVKVGPNWADMTSSYREQARWQGRNA